MTIFYLDPVAGNDASSGVDWANAWKTFASGPTSARIAPGDEIRIAKSPDPTTVGTATWTNRKIGNSVTFASAPTKQIDKCKTGWVTLGAGATVTNNQSSAYMMWDATPGTGSALQVATSASANGAYKALGSTVDFSAHQQISFWFRSTAGFDCTGAQNLNIRLCSDTAGATPVDTLVAPKWNYAANTWYPIVIDKGSALGASIQSVSYNTTNTTTQTFYFDEMFASPAAGLTLWSLIEDNDSAWYGIRTIRDENVWLLGVYAPGTATGAANTVGFLDSAWVGTTETFSTRKRETLKAYGSSGPSNTNWCTNTEAGTWTSSVKLLDQYRFGFNTSSNTQDGHTFADNLIGTGTGLTASFANWRYENFVGVKWGTPVSIAAIAEFNKLGAVASGAMALNSFTSTTVLPTYNKTFEFLCCTGGATAAQSLTFGSTGVGAMNFNINFGKLWCTGGWTISAIHGSNLTFKDQIHGGTTSMNALNVWGSTYNKITVPKLETVVCYQYTTGSNSPNVFVLSSTASNYIKINSMYSGAGTMLTSSFNDILDIGEYAGTASLIGVASASMDGVIIRCVSNNSSAALKWLSGTGMAPNGKVYIQDYSGAGTAAVFTGCGNTSASVPPSYFELQTGDIHTSGSKAWKYTGQGFMDFLLGSNDYLKLASVAAVANKLVTITCYVKNITAYQDAYIAVPAIFLPGYTSDIKTSFTGTVNTWQQLTITFTPTADCVFDVIAGVYYNSVVADTNAVWDDLVITQAA